MSANSQRDEKGRFIAGNAYAKNLKRDENGRFVKRSRLELIKSVVEAKKFDYSDDKQLVDTLAKDDDNSMPEAPKTYDLDDIRQAFYAGSNASRFYSIIKQWEIYKDKNYDN